MKSVTVYGVVISLVLLVTVLFWGVLLIQIWSHDMSPTGTPYVAPTLLFWACGALLTALGTAVAAAIGFSIQDLKVKFRNTAKVERDVVIATFGWPVIVATAAYFLLGILIFLTAAIPLGAGGFEALQVYAVTFIGWLAGALTLLKPATTPEVPSPR